MSQTTQPAPAGNRIFTSDEIARIRSRWDQPEFGPTTEALVAAAELAIRDDLRPADRAAGWGHGYFCPDHVVQLEFDPADPATHRCAVDGRVWTGEEFDGGWRCVLNARIQAAVEASATIWVAAGEDRYLDYAKATLLAYADLYPALPPSGIHVGKGKVTGQSLEEAVWALSMARAFDLIAPALSADEYATISTDLFRVAADHVTGQLLHRIHNIECWHLSCLGTLGVVLDDPELVKLSYEGELGLAVQLDHGILADGWWAEGSPNYHSYMLSAALNGILALRHPHPESYREGPLRSMFDAPLGLMRSDLSLPALNDGWNSVAMPGGVGQFAAHYEMGYQLWGDQRFADVLHDLYGGPTPSARRTSAWALWFGPDLEQPRGDSRWELRPVHPASGYAVLSRGEGPDQRSIMVKYGPHGGGHGHPDKLEIDLHAYGERLAPDAGSPSYNSPLQGPWFRHTLSHSTALVNHASQPPNEGRLIAYLPAEHDLPAAVEVAVAWPEDLARPAGREGSWLREPRYRPDPGYAGAVFHRFLAQTEDYIVDLFWCRVPSGAPLELALHHRGVLRSDSTPLRTVDGWEPHDETYAYLTNLREPMPETSPGAGSTWHLGWDLERAGGRVWGYDAPGQRTLVADAPSNPPAETLTTVLRGLDGPIDEDGAVFATVVEPLQGTPAVQAVTWSGTLADGLELTVATPRGEEAWRFDMADAPTSVRRESGTVVCTLTADAPA